MHEPIVTQQFVLHTLILALTCLVFLAIKMYVNCNKNENECCQSDLSENELDTVTFMVEGSIMS